MEQTKPLFIQDTLQNLITCRPIVKGTTLITYVVSGSIDVWLISQHLKSEISSANNIKSKQVRSAVLDSLKSLMSIFEHYCPGGKTPINGLVMLSGYIDTHNSKDISYYV